MEGINNIIYFYIVLINEFVYVSKLYMVFDYFNGGELYHYLSKGRFTEERARFYAAEISLGLAHLHNNGIIYRLIFYYEL